MNKFPPLFIIGTLGMWITSSLHMFFTLLLSVSSAHSTFYVIYPTFITFLAIGFGIMLNTGKESKFN